MAAVSVRPEMRASETIANDFPINPANPNAEPDTRAVVAAAALLHHRIVTERATTQAEIERAFGALTAQNINALLIFPTPYSRVFENNSLRWLHVTSSPPCTTMLSLHQAASWATVQSRPKPIEIRVSTSVAS